jgi:F0F1-type ATP synthase membrane subunit b/b'
LYLLASVGGVNTGDIIFQLVSFLLLLAIPVGVIIVVVVFRKRNSRQKRIEEKLDKLLSDKEKEKL